MTMSSTPTSPPVDPMTADSGPETTQAELPGAGSGTAGEGTIEELRARVAELDAQGRRTLADLDNLRKRTAREADRTRELARAEVAGAWLPVVDHLELALHHADADPDAVIAGVDAV